ncbi:flagellar basal body-associated FliL family protein [Proteiniclasticum ruminis]
MKEGGLAGAKVKIKASINAALGEDVVAEVYFTEFLVQ